VKQFPCSVQNRESSATHRNCSVNGRQNLAESVEMVGDRKNSLLFSLFSVRHRALPDLQGMKAVAEHRQTVFDNLIS
jgi:hypothetical protein